MGAGVKSLAPEYLQRARVDGAASADAWYIVQVRSLAMLQLQSSR